MLVTGVGLSQCHMVLDWIGNPHDLAELRSKLHVLSLA